MSGNLTSPPSNHPVDSTANRDENANAGLRQRRDELANRVAEMYWDLGGLTYEMAIRDHFRLDVIVRRAAELQVVDAELAEVERLLRMEDTATVGSCRACGALHSRGAMYCWQCGSSLMLEAPSSAVGAGGVA